MSLIIIDVVELRMDISLNVLHNLDGIRIATIKKFIDEERVVSPIFLVDVSAQLELLSLWHEHDVLVLSLLVVRSLEELKSV